MTKTTSELTIEKVDHASKALQAAKQSYLDECEALFESYLTALFEEHEGLDIVQFLGWTPGFNDGDPCTHSSELFVDAGNAIIPEGSNSRSYCNWADWGQEETLEELDKDRDQINRLPEETLSIISKNLWKFDTWLQHKYNTDYKIVVTRGQKAVKLPDNWDSMTSAERDAANIEEGSKINIEHSYYECGY